jgi:hypothetical protein
MIVYQLHAEGGCSIGGVFRMASKKVFKYREQAVKFIPEFERLCCDDSQLYSAEKGTLKISVLELELVE